MKTTTSRALVLLAIQCLLFFGVPQAALAAAFSAELRINTTTEFSGWFSVRVGYHQPPDGADGGGSITLTGQLPGSTFHLAAGNPYYGAGADLYDSALNADYGPLGFSGTWYGQELYSDKHHIINGFEYRLEADWSFGGLNPGYDPDPELHLWPEDFWWGYWSGSFSIKRLSAAPPAPDRVPDSGRTLALFAGALGLIGSVRRGLVKHAGLRG